MNTLNTAVRQSKSPSSALAYDFQLEMPDMEHLSRFQDHTLMSSGPASVMAMFMSESLSGMASVSNHITYSWSC